jgi:hypothetical protein
MAESELTEVQKLAEYNVDKLIRGHEAIEEARDILTAEYKAQIKPLEEKMQEIIGALGIKLAASGQENFKTQYGTYYNSTIKKVKVTNRGAWLDWVYADWNQRKDCLTQHVAKEEVVKFNEAGDEPEGVEISDYTSGHIRKA